MCLPFQRALIQEQVADLGHVDRRQRQAALCFCQAVAIVVPGVVGYAQRPEEMFLGILVYPETGVRFDDGREQHGVGANVLEVTPRFVNNWALERKFRARRR